MGQRHVPDHLILYLVKIISSCTKLYSTHLGDLTLSSNTRHSTSRSTRTSSPRENASEISLPLSKAGTQGSAFKLISRVNSEHVAGTPSSSFFMRHGSAHGVGGTDSPKPVTSSRIKEDKETEEASAMNESHPRLSVTGAHTGPVPAVVEAGKILGVDVIPLGREKFAKHCLECLLNLCKEDESKGKGAMIDSS
jgi:hypothetical protein